MWVLAGLFFAVIAGVASLLFLAKTTVEVTPRTHRITFDQSTPFTAYPESSASENAIVYKVQQSEFEDSQTVPATGSEKAEDRASGNVTVYNAYSTSPVRLIKNTRFESPSGLIFKIPSSVEVPGKKGSTPGEITVTVFADTPGAEYNVPPTDKFTLPGLKSSPDMYNSVYARSITAFSGGFVGERPAVSPQALESARAEIRSRLQTKVKEAISSIADGYAFESLASVVYESRPTTADSGGARVTEKAIVSVPVFPSDKFAKAIAQAVSADAAESKVVLVPGDRFGAAFSGEKPESLGTSPLVFTLTGNGTILWEVVGESLREALAGKDQAAFKPIVSTFIGIKDAQARIAPFWSTKFPSDPSDIEVIVTDPTKSE
jgi:hypothetical protein